MKTELNNVFPRLDSLLRSYTIIWTILYTALVVINISQFFVTKNLWIGMLVKFCAVSSIAILPYMKRKLHPSLLELDDYYMTIHSLMTFVLIVIGITPLELLLITDMNLDLIGNLGFFKVIELCDLGRAMLAITVFLFVSIIFWMLLIEARKEAILYIKCKKIKKEIYE